MLQVYYCALYISEIFKCILITILCRSPAPFGTTKYLLDMISKDVQSKVQSYQDLYTQQR